MSELPPMELGYPRTEPVVETIEVRVVPAREVDLQFARDEGFESVGEWRRARESFWAEHEIDDETLIVAERFRLVERLS
jgi:uncharacterized protein YhfF